jgi:hypothetical protein
MGMKKILAILTLSIIYLWISVTPKVLAEASCPDLGRVVDFLLMLSLPSDDPGQPGPVDYMDQMLDNSVSWVGKGMPDIKVLVIRDDNHHDEYPEDTDNVYNALLALGYDTTLIDEPEEGVDYSELEGYDVALLSNPGWPVDDFKTVQALQRFFSEGGGVILQGDDTSWGVEGLERLTHLRSLDNGFGSYQVEIIADTHPVIDGLEGVSFSYPRDIDICEPLGEGEVILAWTEVEYEGQVMKTPVITAYEAPVKIEGLIACKERCFASGGIDNRGVANSLGQKLEAAKAALDRGKTSVAVNILNAFVNELEAQSGKHISPRCADLLIGYANRLISVHTGIPQAPPRQSATSKLSITWGKMKEN